MTSLRWGGLTKISAGKPRSRPRAKIQAKPVNVTQDAALRQDAQGDPKAYDRATAGGGESDHSAGNTCTGKLVRL